MEVEAAPPHARPSGWHATPPDHPRDHEDERQDQRDAQGHVLHAADEPLDVVAEGAAEKIPEPHHNRHEETRAENVPRAPRTLIETTRIFRESDVARDWFGDDFVYHYAATREWEWRQWLDVVTDWEMKRYFEII